MGASAEGYGASSEYVAARSVCGVGVGNVRDHVDGLVGWYGVWCW
jgi:hypothetical protein